jgi:nucleotide-binding universal stress UspA family protein
MPPSASILVAADEASGERHGIRIARQLSLAQHADLTILSVHSPAPALGHHAGEVLSTRDRRMPHLADELTHFCRWLGPDSVNGQPNRPEVAVAFGVPGIEIARLAAAREVSLVILGRQHRAPDHPVALGQTADALVRRSERPTLFVPTFVTHVRSIVVAVDGSDRTMPVLDRTLDFARQWGAETTVLTVETPGEAVGASGGGAGSLRHGVLAKRTHTEQLAAHLDQWRRTHGPALPTPPLIIRRGDPIVEVLAYLGTTRPDVLAIGYRRGGQPKVIGPADIARNLMFSAPSAVLTVPI